MTDQTYSSDCLFYFCSENGRISILILRWCSKDVVICFQFVVVEFFAVLGPSSKYCLFSVRRVPFLSLMFDDRLDLFWRGLSRWNKPVWCCFPSSRALFQCTVRLSSRSLLFSFFFQCLYLVLGTVCVLLRWLVFFSSRVWSQSFNTSLDTHD